MGHPGNNLADRWVEPDRDVHARHRHHRCTHTQARVDRAKPQGSSTQASAMLFLCAGDRTFVEDESGPFFGPATTFISYFWQAALFQLVEAIERRHSSSSSAFYWIDILNCAQCRHNDRAKQFCEDDGGKFAETIAQSEARVWMHCDPWYKPRTFGRVWYAPSRPLTLLQHCRALNFVNIG